MDIKTIRQVGVALIALLLVALMAGQVIGAIIDVSGMGQVETSLNIQDGRADIPVGNNRQWRQSLGDALGFDGSGDAEFSSGGAIKLSGGAELCTWVEIDASGQNQTIVTADGELFLRYAGNRSTPKWVAEHYNRSDRTLYDVAANASSVGSWTHLCARADSGQLVLAVNATDVATVSEDGTHTTDVAAASYGTLDGRVDETRVYDAPLTATQRSTLYQTPTHPLEQAADARIMYDDYDKTPDTLPIYFTGATGDVKNAALADGLAGQSLRQGTDYKITDGEIVVTRGARLDRAPVVWLTYDGAGTFDGVVATIINIGGSALALLVVGVLLLAVKSVTDEFVDGGGGL